MLSYRTNLAKIGIRPGQSVSYRNDFYSRPQSLRQAIRSMDAPQDWQQVSDISLDQNWTQECQGVAWDGARWIFSSNGSENPVALDPTPKALFIFNGGTPLKDKNIIHTFRFVDHIPNPSRLYHVGHLYLFNGYLYVDHFIEDGGGQVIVLKPNGESFEYVDWIPLELVDGQRVNLVAINPWDGMFYTCLGDGEIKELYIHNTAGEYTKRKFPLTPSINDKGYVQGGFFSPNGHLYISSGKKNIGKYQKIYCYSALNGHRFNEIGVLSEESSQELEGICYADVSFSNGRRAQIHAVLLENVNVAKDNIFFKSFATSQPDIV